MKIAFLNIYAGVNNRGAESFTSQLIKNLQIHHQVDLFTGSGIKTKIIQPVHKTGFLKRFFLDKVSLSVLVFTLKIYLDLWRSKYDWVIPMNGFWQVILCKLLIKPKVLITGHSGPGWEERWNLWLKPDVFVATTEPTAIWARKICPWTKVVTIPYGIDKYVGVKPVKLALERPVILCPAAAVEYKRVDLTIKAVAQLKKGSLVYLGSGPLIDKIENFGKELLGPTRFLNLSVDISEMPSYYLACDLVTLASGSQENSPMVFLEAMAAGKFTVTTDAPRPKWILGKAGIFIDPTDLDSYAKALEMGIQKKDKNIIEQQLEKYSWKNILQSYEGLLQN